jgi:hypothetical protein
MVTYEAELQRLKDTNAEYALKLKIKSAEEEPT